MKSVKGAHPRDEINKVRGVARKAIEVSLYWIHDVRNNVTSAVGARHRLLKN